MPEEAGSATVHAPVATMTFLGPLRMRERKFFSWRIVYLRMNRRLVRLREQHTGPVEQGELYGEIDSFFLDCNHLREWMVKDTKSPHALPQAVRDQVQAFARGDDALATAIGFANTSKHMYRDPAPARKGTKQPEDMTAKIVATVIGGGQPMSVLVQPES